jgi:hypothetical protein
MKRLLINGSLKDYTVERQEGSHPNGTPERHCQGKHLARRRILLNYQARKCIRLLFYKKMTPMAKELFD